MTSIRFDPTANLIVVRARILGPLGEVVLKLALDTGATDTLIVPYILDELGYCARDVINITATTGVVDEQPGYELPVKRFAALGFEFSDFIVNAQDLHERAILHGLRSRRE